MGEPDIQDEVEVPETAQETVSTSAADAEEDAVLDRLLGISEETSVSTNIAEKKPEVPVTTSQVTANPSRASRSAMALPIPRDEPVMMATLPVRSNSSIAFPVCFCGDIYRPALAE